MPQRLDGEMKAEKKSIKQCFDGCLYNIPAFQRDYTWDENNLKDFWKDLTERQREKTITSTAHFLGATVVYCDSVRRDFRETYAIIDGQQRLTTAQILLACIRDTMTRISQNTNSTEEVGTRFASQARITHNYIVATDDDEKTHPVLDRPERYFRTVIQEIETIPHSLDESLESALEHAYTFFNNRINELLEKEKTPDAAIQALKSIRTSLLTSEVIQIAVSNLAAATVVFETLNSRGKPLESKDLLKSLIIRTGSNTPDDQIVLADRWRKICDRAEKTTSHVQTPENEKQPTRFLIQSWNSRYPYARTKLFHREATEHIQCKESAIGYLEHLEEDIAIYEHFGDTDLACVKDRHDCNPFAVPEAVDSIRALSVFKVSTPHSLLLSCLRKYKSRGLRRKELIAVTRALEVFYFYNIHGDKRNGRINELFARYALMISRASDKSSTITISRELVDYLCGKIPDTRNRETVFKSFRYPSAEGNNSSSEVIRYVLFSIARYSKKLPLGAPINGNSLTIEHIVPRSSTAVPHDLVCGIGNLTLLPQEVNNELHDKDFESKRDQLKKYVPYIDSSLESYLSDRTKHSLSAADITSRLDTIVRMCANEVWTIPRQ